MDKTNARTPLIYLLVLIFLFLCLVSFLALNIQDNRIENTFKQGRAVRILFLLIDEELDKPLITSIIFFNNDTKKSAILNIPENTGRKIQEGTIIDRVDRIDIVYTSSNRERYQNIVEELIDMPIDFTLILTLEKAEKLIDIMGGIQLFIPEQISIKTEDDIFLLPSGSSTLDGSKALDYILYRVPDEESTDILKRENLFTQAFLTKIAQSRELLLHKNVFPHALKLIESDLDKKALKTFLKSLKNTNMGGSVFRNVLGIEKNVDGQILLFPFHKEKLLAEEVRQMESALEQTTTESGSEVLITIEILNGTKTNGLASRTSSMLQSFGYHIGSVTNADTNDLEKTVILDRKGNTDAAHKVGNILRCDNIFQDMDVNTDDTIDITIIIGKDFDGRYVKK